MKANIFVHRFIFSGISGCCYSKQTIYGSEIQVDQTPQKFEFPDKKMMCEYFEPTIPTTVVFYNKNSAGSNITVA